MNRTIRHLLTPRWLARRGLRKADVAAIARAVAVANLSHRGELRLMAEGPLSPGRLLRRQTPKERAFELHSGLAASAPGGVGDVLVYVQLVDRRAEIVPSPAVAEKVGQDHWDAIAREMEVACRAGAYRRGILDAIERISRLLDIHFPARKSVSDVPERPVLI